MLDNVMDTQVDSNKSDMVNGQPPAAIPNSVQLSNFFSLLGQLGSKEIPPH